MSVTKHTCGGPAFGKRTAGCPRCDELANGAKPVKWVNNRKRYEAMSLHDIRGHNCVASRCGVVCTHGQW